MSVLVEIDGSIGTIVLDRPDRMNAITTDLARGLESAVRSLGDDPRVRVVQIRGAGGNFCAGGDFEEVQRLRSAGAEPLRGLFDAFGSVCRAIGEIGPPVVAVVEGVAMAGGFELVQAVDVALVRTDARLSDTHVNFDQIPGGGGSQRLARLVGRSRALGHILSGERLTGVEAERWGLALHAWEPAEFEQRVEEFLQRLAARRPEATVTIKRLVRDGLEGPLATGLEREVEAVVEHILGEAGGAGEFATRGTTGRTS